MSLQITLDEAIEILTNDLKENIYDKDSRIEAAEKLGIESLKREKEFRDNNTDVPVILLPGETKD